MSFLKKDKKKIDLEDPELSVEEVMSVVYDDIEEKINAEEEEDGLREEGEGEGEEEGREEIEEGLEEGEPTGEEEGEKKEAIEEEGEDEDEDGEKIEATISSTEFDPPQNWTDDAKEEFKELPQKQQTQILEMQRGMQSDFQKTMNAFGGITNALEPIKNECVQMGLKYEDAIRKMVGMHVQLMQDPIPAMQTLLQTYGVTSEQVLGVKPDTGIPPAADDRITQLENRVNQTTQGMFNQHMAGVDAQVQELIKSGKHFAEVEDDMAILVDTYQRTGQPLPPLKELYDKACWSNPQVRAKLMAEQKAEETNEKVEQRKKQVDKSKRAARTSKRGTSGHTEEKDPPKSLHDVLSRQWDEAERKAKEAG